MKVLFKAALIFAAVAALNSVAFADAPAGQSAKTACPTSQIGSVDQGKTYAGQTVDANGNPIVNVDSAIKTLPAPQNP